MTPDEFISIGSRLFTRPGASSSHGWQARAAAHFGVSDRTVRNWVSGCSDVPEGVAREMRAMVAIVPPPPGSSADEDRDDAMRDALDPALARVASEYVAAGWHEGEIVTAMLGFAIDTMCERAGAAATIETLRQAVDAIKSSRDT